MHVWALNGESVRPSGGFPQQWYFCRDFSSELVNLDFSYFTVEQIENTQERPSKQTNIKQTDNSNISKIKRKTNKTENKNNNKKKSEYMIKFEPLLHQEKKTVKTDGYRHSRDTEILIGGSFTIDT